MKSISRIIVRFAWRGLVPVLAVAAVMSLALAQGAGAQAMKKIVFILDWDGLSAQHQGFWLAQGKGWFAAEGLDVRLKPGWGSGKVAQVVVGGRGDIGEMSTTVLAQVVAKQSAPLISVSVFHQRDNLSMVFFESTGIKKPKDLEGRKLGMVPGSVAQLLWPAFAKVNKIDTSTITLIKTDYRLYVPQLVSKQFDVSLNYVVGNRTDLILEKGGEKAKQFVFSDYLPILGQTVVVTKKKLAEDPKMVKGFLRAVGKAWAYIDRDPDKALLEAAQFALKQVKRKVTPEIVAKFNRMSSPEFQHSPGTKGKPIGWSRPQDWREMIDVMASVDKFPRKPTVGEMMTNRFYE